MEQRFIPVFLFIFLFIGSFVVLISIIPSDFAVSTKNYANQSQPEGESWSAYYLQATNDSVDITLNNTAYQYYEFTIGGRNLDIVTWQVAGVRWIVLQHRFGFSWFWSRENLLWFNEDGYNYQGALYGTNLNTDFGAFNRTQYIAKCQGLGGSMIGGYSSAFQVQTVFNFNRTAYGTPDHAWEHEELVLTVSIGMDQSSTSMNAWDMISRLLMFQKLDVAGASNEGNAFNMILGYAFWACIACMALIIILELIPF